MEKLKHSLGESVRRISPLTLVVWALMAITAIFHPPILAAGPLVPHVADTTLIDQITQALKIVFNEPFFDNVVADSEFGDAFEEGGGIKYDETTGGRYVENLHELAWPAGVGARLEDDYIPVADGAEYANSQVFLKRIMGTIQMSSAVMDRVRTNEGAYLDYMERALPLLQKRVTSERDRMILGWGYAVKARVAAISAYNSPAAGQFQVTVDRSMGIDGYTEAPLQFLRGERSVFTPSLAAPIALDNPGSTQSGRVKNVQIQTNVVTYEGAQALHDAINVDDYIGAGDGSGYSFPAGNPAETKEITGVLAAVDGGDLVSTYMNLPRANEEYWQGNMIDSQAAPFSGTMTESLLVYADRVNTVNGAGKIDMIICNRVAEEQYWQSLKQDRQIVNPQGTYEGGKDQLWIRLNGRRLMIQVARKIPTQIAFGLERDTFKCFRLREWFWDDRTGSMWNRVVDSTGFKSAYFATGYFWEELFCGAPAKNFRLNNLLSSPA